MLLHFAVFYFDYEIKFSFSSSDETFKHAHMSLHQLIKVRFPASVVGTVVRLRPVMRRVNVESWIKVDGWFDIITFLKIP